jgi:uncharacterized protein (DUF697 family)
MSIPKTIEELDEIKEECMKMVNKRATVSGLITVVPIPGVDVLADVRLLRDLMEKVSEKFGLTADQVDRLDEETKQIVLTVVKQSGKNFIKQQIQKAGKRAGKVAVKKLVSAVMRKQAKKETAKTFGKFIPVVGQFAAAGIGYTAMMVAGRNHVNDCYKIMKKVMEKKETNLTLV